MAERRQQDKTDKPETDAPDKGQAASKETAKTAEPQAAPQVAPPAEGAPPEAPGDQERQAAAAKPQGDERVFSKERLIQGATGLLGHPPHVVAGALAEEDDDVELDVASARERVETFLTREVEA